MTARIPFPLTACVSLVACATQPLPPAQRVPLRQPPAAALIAQQRQTRQEGSAGGHGVQDGFDVGATLTAPRTPPATGLALVGVHVASPDSSDQHVVGALRVAAARPVELGARYSLQRYEVDAVTGATQQAPAETVHGVEAGGRYDDGSYELGGAVGFDSAEDRSRPWMVLSTSAALGERFQLGGDLGYAATSVGRVGSEDFEESFSELSAGVRLRWDAADTRALSLAYALARLDGYLGSPYAFVLVGPLTFPESLSPGSTCERPT